MVTKMEDFQRWKQQIARLCDQAANGSLTIEEFYEQWPEEVCKTGIAQLIYEDLEEGVQHFPARLLSGKPDYESWQSSELYQRILVDKKILKLNESEDRLIEVRNALLKSKSK